MCEEKCQHAMRADMANARADRWKARYDNASSQLVDLMEKYAALISSLEAAADHRKHCSAPTCCTEVLNGSE